MDRKCVHNVLQVRRIQFKPLAENRASPSNYEDADFGVLYAIPICSTDILWGHVRRGNFIFQANRDVVGWLRVQQTSYTFFQPYKFCCCHLGT